MARRFDLVRRFPAFFAALVVAAWAVPVRGDGGADVDDFYNVVAPAGADPWVIRHGDGRYYATITTGWNVTLCRSETLSGLGGAERKVIWTPPRDGPASKNLWAPEIHRIGSRWYVYYAADDGDNAHHRMYVLENDSEDPFEGTFAFKGKIADPVEDRWAIDGTVLQLGERLYFVWSGWEGDVDVRQDIYIAPMRNPWTLDGPRAAISRPTLPWEVRGGPPGVNEGPQVLVRDDRVFIVYSASGSWTDHYCLGLLRASADDDLLSPASWTKHPRPVFVGGNGVFGPGHCSFVASPDGSEDWIVYHSARYQGSGWTRLLRAQRFGWSEDGLPDFGRPAPPDRPIPLPSGEPRRRRFEAEDARREGDAHAVVRDGASAGSAVGGMDAAGSALTFEVTAEDAGTYLAVIRYGGEPPKRERVAHRLDVNGGPAGELRYEHSGRGGWSNAFVRLELAAGMNRVRFAGGGHPVELDCLDLIRERPAKAE